MDSERWKRVRALFEEAADRRPAERDAWLASECAGDPELKSAVESMLAVETPPDFLISPTGAAPFHEPSPAPTVEPGRRIGNYEILQPVASGGMGTVYEALQIDPRRRVALKVMRLGLGTPSAVRRFRYESELLARLVHPGIAQVHEAGVHSEDGMEDPLLRDGARGGRARRPDVRARERPRPARPAGAVPPHLSRGPLRPPARRDPPRPETRQPARRRHGPDQGHRLRRRAARRGGRERGRDDARDEDGRARRDAVVHQPRAAVGGPRGGRRARGRVRPGGRAVRARVRAHALRPARPLPHGGRREGHAGPARPDRIRRPGRARLGALARPGEGARAPLRVGLGARAGPAPLPRSRARPRRAAERDLPAAQVRPAQPCVGRRVRRRARGARGRDGRGPDRHGARASRDRARGGREPQVPGDQRRARRDDVRGPSRARRA